MAPIAFEQSVENGRRTRRPQADDRLVGAIGRRWRKLGQQALTHAHAVDRACQHGIVTGISSVAERGGEAELVGTYTRNSTLTEIFDDVAVHLGAQERAI